MPTLKEASEIAIKKGNKLTGQETSSEIFNLAGLPQPTPSQDPNFVKDPTKNYDVFGNVVGNKPPANRYGTGNEVEDYYAGQDTTPYTPTETADVFAQQRQLQQSNIDALNQIYNRQVQAAQQEGEESLGRGRSMLARGGLLGGPRGEAQQAGRRAETKADIAGIDERRQLAITQIMSKADDRATLLVEAEKTRALGAEEKYIDYKQGVQTESRTDFKALASTGNMDWSMLDEEDQEMWKQQTGYSDFEADYVFNTYKPEQEQIKWNAPTWRGNDMVMTGIDPATGELVTKTYTGEELGITPDEDPHFFEDETSGELMYIDKNDLEAGVKTMGKFGLSAEQKQAYDLQKIYANKAKTGEESLTAGQVRDIKYLESAPDWFRKRVEKTFEGQLQTPTEETIQSEWQAMKTEDEDVNKEETIWAWLSTPDAQALTSQEKKNQIMNYGLNPNDFNIY